MNHASASAQLDRMPQVQHFVVNQIFNRVSRHVRAVENAADDDGVVRRVVMAQAAQGVLAAPGHLRTRHQAVKEAQVQLVENLIEIVVLAFGTFNALASAKLADKVGLLRHGAAAGELAIARGVPGVDGFAIQLGNQNMQDSVQHRLGRAFQQIGEADKNLALAQTDGVVDVGESIE